MGIDSTPTSPTFSLQQCYADRLFHYDLYNRDLASFMELGLLEELENEGIHLLEWGDSTLEKVLQECGFEPIIIDIAPHGDKRTYRICHA